MTSSNAAGYAIMDRYLEFLRQVPGLAKDAAPVVAKGVEQLEREMIAAQRDPYGEAWEPGKQGQPVLQGAMAAIDVRGVDTTVLITLTGIETLHHIGAAKGYRGGSRGRGGYRRSLIPFKAGGLPGPFKGVVRVKLNEEFQHLKHTYGAAGGRGTR